MKQLDTIKSKDELVQDYILYDSVIDAFLASECMESITYITNLDLGFFCWGVERILKCAKII